MRRYFLSSVIIISLLGNSLLSYSQCTAAFTFSPTVPTCSSTPVNFYNQSTGAISFLWNFGNPASGSNNTSTQQNPTHLFIAYGNGTEQFVVTLIVTFINNCVDTATNLVAVKQSPDPSIEDANNNLWYHCVIQPDTTATLVLLNTSTTQSTNTYYQINWGDGSNIQ